MLPHFLTPNFLYSKTPPLVLGEFSLCGETVTTYYLDREDSKEDREEEIDGYYQQMLDEDQSVFETRDDSEHEQQQVYSLINQL